MTTVAVAVCSTGWTDALSKCLLALQRQSVPKGYLFSRVILVINGSRQKAVEANVVVSKTWEENLNRIPSLEVVHEPRIGIAEARNAALRVSIAKGVEWLAFTDDDCLPEIDWLRKLVGTQAEQKVDAVAGGTLIKAVGATSPWLPDHVFGMAGYPPFAFSNDQSGHLRYAYTRNVLFRVKGIQRFFNGEPLFDERLSSSGGEDVDFFLRASLNGFRIRFDPTAVVSEFYEFPRTTLLWWFRRRMRNAVIRAKNFKTQSLSVGILSALAGRTFMPRQLQSSARRSKRTTHRPRTAKKILGSCLLFIAPLAGGLLWCLGWRPAEYKRT